MSVAAAVLCLTRAAIPLRWRPEEGAVPLAWTQVLETLEPRRPWLWLPREEAAEDLRWKQPVPYVLVREPCGRLACHPRPGPRARRLRLWRLGFGGPVERIDQRPTLRETLLARAQRALEESLGLVAPPLQFLGAINEEHSRAGRGRWGLVFLATLPQAIEDSPELGLIHWVRPHACRLPLDRWSHLALHLSDKPVSPGPLPGDEVSSPLCHPC